MKYNLAILIVVFVFSNKIIAQSEEISFEEIKYNVNLISKSFIQQQQSSGFDYLTITLDDFGNRWFCLSWNNLDGLRVNEQRYSIEMAVKFFSAVYQNYNYKKEYPINKIQFINALKNKKIIGIKTITKNNEFYTEWQELINKGYL